MEISEVLAFFWHPSELSGVELGQLLSLGAKACNEYNSVSSWPIHIKISAFWSHKKGLQAGHYEYP